MLAGVAEVRLSRLSLDPSLQLPVDSSKWKAEQVDVDEHAEAQP